MKSLKTILGLIYPILIILLLLNNCNGCSREQSTETPPPTPLIDSIAAPTPEDEVEIDSTTGKALAIKRILCNRDNIEEESENED